MTTTLSKTPSVLSNTKPRPSLLDARPQLAAAMNLDGKVVRPAPHTERRKHDGIVKAKHLKPGQIVQAYLQGHARGGSRTVESVTRLGDGSMVRITWSSGQAPADYKAAYRWFDAALVGKPVNYVVPAFEVIR
jgi:hypothetical protein